MIQRENKTLTEAWNGNDPYIKLAVPREFSFDVNLHYLSRSTNECMLHIDNNRVSKLITVDQEKLIVEISSDSEGFLNLQFMGDTVPSNDKVRGQIVQHVREWFDLDTDLQPFYDKTQHDPLLQKVIKRFYGLRVMGIPDLFEALCWGIIGQQINLTFAYTLKRRFVETFGQSVALDGKQYWEFPTPSHIAQLNISDLTALQMTGKKSEYLIGVAKLLAEGALTKELLINMKDYKEMEKRLVSIRGIGPWTANYVLMRCLKSPSAFPIEDVGLHNAIKHLLEIDRKPTLEEIKKFASGWADWESYATFYLWRTLY